MRCIVADTSSILFALSNNFNLFKVLSEEVPGAEIAVSRGIIRELKGIGGSSKKHSAQAKVALAFIESGNVTIDKSDAYPDKWILEAAKAGNCLVCTNDGKLKKALRLNGIRAFSIGKDGKVR